MAKDLERLIVRIDATTEQLRREMKRAEISIDTFGKKTDLSTKRISSGFDSINKTARLAATGLGVLGASLSVGKLVQYSDSYKEIEGRLKLVTKSTAEFSDVNNRLFKVAQGTRQSFESTADLYTKLARSSDQLGLSQTQLIQFTETVNQSFVVSGAAASESAGAIRQLSQAMASGVLRGDEFNSIMENAPRIQEALATSLDVTKGELREMAAAGLISSEKVVNALLKQSEVIRAEFSQMPKTVSQAFTELDNSFLKMLGTSQAVRDSTNTIAIGVSGLANNLDNAALAVGAIATVMGGKLAASLATSTQATIAQTQATMAQRVATVAAAKEMVISQKVAVANAVAHYNLHRAASGTQSATLQMGLAAQRVTTAQQALTASLAIQSKTLIGVAGYARLAGGALLTAFGGGIGLAIAGVAGGIYLLSQRQELAEKATSQHEEAMQALNEITLKYNGNSVKTREALRDEATKRLEVAAATIAETQAKVRLLEVELYNRTSGGFFKEDTFSDTKAIVNEQDALLKSLEAQFDNVVELQNQLSGLKPEELFNNVSTAANKASASVAGFSGKTANKLKELAEKQATYTEQVERSVAELERLTVAREQGEEAYEATSEAIERENELRQQGIDINTKEGQALDRLLQKKQQQEAAIEKIGAVQRKAQEASDRYAESLFKPYETAMENIQNVVTDTFEGLFDGSIDSAGDAADAIKKIFFRMAAETATLRLLGPQGLSGIIGGAGSLVGSGNFVNGAGGGIGSINDLISGFSGFSNFGGSLSGTLAGNFVDNIGASLGLSNANFVGPMLPGQSAGLSGGFTGGAALAGFAGNFGADLLFGNRGIGSSIGGGLGGVAGTAIGSNLGTLLGFAGGPAGALLGAFGGNLLGGLFGGKKPSDKTQYGTTDLETGAFLARGGFTGKKYSKANEDAVTALSDASVAIAKLLDVTGKINLTVGSRDGLRYSLGEGNATKRTNNPNGFFDSLIDDFLLQGTKQLSNEVINAIDAINWGGGQKALQDALDDFGFIVNYDSLGGIEEVTKTIGPFQQALKDLNEQFTTLSKTEMRLFNTTVKVFAAQEKAKQKLIETFDTSILAILNPAAVALKVEVERYKAQLEEAIAIGANVEQVELLHQRQMAQINAELNKDRISALNGELQIVNDLTKTLGGLSGTYEQLLDRMNVGDLSGLSPLSQLKDFRTKISGLENLSLLGDAAAQSKLAELLPKFVELSGSINGYNRTFSSDLDLARGLSERTKEVIDRQLSIQEQIAASTLNEIEVLESGFSSVVNALMAVTDISPSAFGLSLPGFATGGLISGGVKGVDSVPIMAMPDEFMMRASAVRNIGADTMAHINQTGQLPANDIGSASEIRALRQDVQILARLMAENNYATDNGTDRVVSRLDSMLSDRAVAAWR